MNTVAVVIEAPEQLTLGPVTLSDPTAEDVVVRVEWSGISTGTERLLYSGRMPPFSGMGYPLVPGYESVGRVVAAGPAAAALMGERVFVPGARCFKEVHGLFGGASARLVVPGARVTPIGEDLGERGTLLALAATAYHALDLAGATPDLIVGHGTLGRLLARLAVAQGGEPTVWEKNFTRSQGGAQYRVVHPDRDARRDYRLIVDASGDAGLLDTLIARLAPRGEVVLAGFYSEPLSFAFPPAFLREARIRVAAEWRPVDLAAVAALIGDGTLSLDGLITHTAVAEDAPRAYRTAFSDPACLKMVLDWRSLS